MSLKRTRYYFEHELLPRVFFEKKGEFINMLQEYGGRLLYRMMLWECEEAKVSCKYIEQEYRCTVRKMENGWGMLCMKFPRAKKPCMCPLAFCIFGEGYSWVRYFMVESGRLGARRVFFLCEWNPQRYHYNYGSVPDNISAIENKLIQVVQKGISPIVKSRCR